MEEGSFDEKKQQREEIDLEKRLAAYYGPALPEQSLSPASWEHLRRQLDIQPPLRHRFSLDRMKSPVPASIRDTFARIAYHASVAYVPARLRCTFKSRMHMPVVRISLLDRRSVKLLLPVAMRGTMSQAELDVLLATGLARYVYAQRPIYVLMHLLLPCIVLLMCLSIMVFSIGILPTIVFLIVMLLSILLGLVVLQLRNKQRRTLAFRADELMVTWLGRSYVCQGLHALADSRLVPRHRRWGEPSLAERIERVCGSRVEAGDPRLVMVR